MTWAQCGCGSTRFELGFESPVPLRDPSRSLTVGPSCLTCAKCGKTYLIHPSHGPGKPHPAHPPTTMVSLSKGVTKLDPLLQQVERNLIRQALDQTGGNRSEAASIMGLSRSRLYRRMEALGITE